MEIAVVFLSNFMVILPGIFINQGGNCHEASSTVCSSRNDGRVERLHIAGFKPARTARPQRGFEYHYGDRSAKRLA